MERCNPSQHCWSSGDQYKIALFYRYVQINNVETLIDELTVKCKALGVMGRVLVSSEGLNGTLAGSIPCINMLVDYFGADARFSKIDWKFTIDRGDNLPFLGLSIRQVEEIISSGQARPFISENIQFDNSTYGGITGTGTHLTPAEFHDAIGRQDGVILDIRNEFEYDIGHFEGSINLKTFNYAETFSVLDRIVGPGAVVPETTSTSQSVSAPEQTAEESESALTGGGANANQNIYMYCTGGIRCEKASAYLCAKGFTNVYQV